MIYEEPLATTPKPCATCSGAFNRWLVEDWTFNYQDRIFAAPYITLADPGWAAEELQWALDQGARSVVMRPAAPVTSTGRRNPFDSSYRGVLGPGRRGGDHRRRPCRRQWPLLQRVCRRWLRRNVLGWMEADDQVLPHRTGHPRLIC